MILVKSRLCYLTWSPQASQAKLPLGSYEYPSAFSYVHYPVFVCTNTRYGSILSPPYTFVALAGAVEMACRKAL
jgi:hypothetical protein